MGSSISLAELVPFMTEIFALGKTVTLTAKGASMAPLLHDGRDSVILGECKNPEKLKPRDLPLYKREDGTYVMHRIIRVHKNSFDMCGDAQTELELGVPKSSVVAVAEGFIRRGKQFPSSSKKYKVFVYLWCLLRPLRPQILRLNSKLRGKRHEKPKA